MTIRDRNVHPEAAFKFYSKVTRVPTASILTLNATPFQLVAAPGSGLFLAFVNATVHKPAGTAYAGIAATEELSFKYTNGSGLNLSTVEATGFMDQTTVQTRWAIPHTRNITTDVPEEIVPVENAAIVAHMVVGEITTGTSDLIIKTIYRVMKMVPDEGVLG